MKYTSRAFTIIEVILVVVVIAIITFVALVNFPKAKLQLSLSRVTYKFEQDVKRAQAMALSSTQYQDSSGILHPVAGYGVYVDQSNNKQYIIYADKTPGDQQYEVGDYVVETIDFSATEPGIIIKQLNNISGSTVSINFSPPSPLTTITPVPTQNSVDVVFASQSDTTNTKVVSVNTAGLVQVGSIGSSGAIVCSQNSDCGTNGFMGSPFCQGNSVYQSYQTYTCNNPGVYGSSCTSTITPQLSQVCSSGAGSWTETQPAGNVTSFWDAAASSSDGTHLIVATAVLQGIGRLYISSNSGTSWTRATPSGVVDTSWDAVASSADGSHLIAGIGFNQAGRLYISSNSGTTWAETRPAGNIDKYWQVVASSSDGSHLIAGVGLGSGAGGRLYISSNSGTTWTETRPAGNIDKNWSVAASSADGTHLIVGIGRNGGAGRLYISSNSGTTWTETQPAGNVDKNWNTVASSSDGSHLIVGVGLGSSTGGRLYISSNSGASWTETRPAGNTDTYWGVTASSSDGTHLIAGIGLSASGPGGRLYLSSNSGTSWTETQPAGNANQRWNAAASDALGAHLIAGIYSGRFYKYTASGGCVGGVCQ